MPAPAKARLRAAVFALRQSSRPLSRRDPDAPTFPWPSEEQAINKGRFVLALYREGLPPLSQGAVRFSNRKQGLGDNDTRLSCG